MILHELQPRHRYARKKRIGRGGKRGTYSGRGQKGQRARAGRRIKPQLREQLLKIPKHRGLGFNRIGSKPATVSLRDIARLFQDGDVINPKILVERRLARRLKGRIPAVKILGGEKFTKKMTFDHIAFSKQARKIVEESGSVIRSISEKSS